MYRVVKFFHPRQTSSDLFPPVFGDSRSRFPSLTLIKFPHEEIGFSPFDTKHDNNRDDCDSRRDPGV